MSARARADRARPKPPPSGDVPDLRALIDAAVPRDDWLAIIGGQAAAAKQGDVRAAQLLLQYRWGKPVPAAIEEPRTLITEIAVVPPPGR